MSDENMEVVQDARDPEFKQPEIENEQPTAKDVEKQQEVMLKNKYPGLNRGPGGGSALLHKRLHKGPKFFDSGDYNVTKSKIGHKQTLTPTEKTLLNESTGNAIPTPNEVHKRGTQRTSSLVVDEPATPSPTE